MSFQLPKLPFARDALEPYMSATTLDYHHGKHHKGYVDKLNGLIQGSHYAGLSLDEIVRLARKSGDAAVFNNAAQAWNHEFLWNSLTPDGGGAPDGRLKDAIDARFGSIDAFREQFRETALGQFGSGWVWLIADTDGLKIIATSNAETPVADGLRALLTLDVWEHAYYLDFRNERAKYVDTFLDELVNWRFAARNYESDRAAA